ncbi:MAG: SDR family oxidoreductase [Sphaerotilus natans subsp. sulfidivorans]|uniref:SDR family oxidoreductase n=1 Tax=Sphaerotilus sulfidivorans TaxID=639200 RepID=UPI0023543C90|nr:SDR family oxidoreductase [Sphaerotilus sulfidivorans]MCK6401331.1 SDR family oxidoreductase [Sphaerotilus sulfidivorans]
MKDLFTPGLLQGRVAFITGGSSGINFHIAQRYAAAGAKVALVGRDADKARAAAQAIVAQGLEAIGLSADVRDYDAIEAALRHTHDQWGPIDIVIAGAAGNFVAPVLGMSSKGFRTVVDIDLAGTFNTVRASHAFLRKPGATVIAISAGHSTMPVAGQAQVCAAKAGVDMLIRTLCIEWGADGIRCLAIAPGPVAETEGMRRLAPEGDRSLQRMLATVPMGRQARLDEVGSLALFLVSGAADYINGAVIPIDGGLTNLGSHAFGEMLLESVQDTTSSTRG